MSVFDLIRTLFGLGGSDASEETEVSVEYDSNDGSTTTGDAESANAEGGMETETKDSAAAAGTDAAASTGSMTEPPSSEPEAAAEPAEAGAGMSEDDEPAAAEPAEDVAPASEKLDSEAEPDETESTSAAVDTISGIGPTYADRLSAADVETVDQLVEADAGELAERTELSEKRIRRWQEDASEG